jgi:hypothetical protein
MKRFLQLVLVLLLVARPAWCTWTQKNSQTGAGTSNPQCATAFSNALTNPSIIIVGVLFNSSTSYTPTDTAGNTYLDSGAGAVAWSTHYIQTFYALNTSTTSSNAVCVTNTSGTVRISATEWTGGATSSAVDVWASNSNASTGTGGGQNATSTAVSTTANGELIYGLVAGSYMSVGTGFTQIAYISSLVGSEYEAQSAGGSVAATWSCSQNSYTYSAMVVAFRTAHPISFIGQPSETFSPSDSATRLATLARTDSETFSPSDSPTRLATLARADSETFSPGDSAARRAGFVRTDGETFSPGDSASRRATLGRTGAETLNPSDSTSRGATLARTGAETLSFSDSPARAAGFSRGAGESLSPGDSATRLVSLVRNDSESLSFADYANRLVTCFRQAAETLVESDHLTAFWQTIQPGHRLAVPGRTKSGKVPGQVKSGTVPAH